MDLSQRLAGQTQGHCGHTVPYSILGKEQMTCYKQACRGLTKGSTGKSLSHINTHCPEEGESGKFRESANLSCTCRSVIAL